MDKDICNFGKGISLKLNVIIMWLEFELMYFHDALKYVNHDTTMRLSLKYIRTHKSPSSDLYTCFDYIYI